MSAGLAVAYRLRLVQFCLLLYLCKYIGTELVSLNPEPPASTVLVLTTIMTHVST